MYKRQKRKLTYRSVSSDRIAYREKLNCVKLIMVCKNFLIVGDMAAQETLIVKSPYFLALNGR